jgi:hypothetical protein
VASCTLRCLVYDRRCHKTNASGRGRPDAYVQDELLELVREMIRSIVVLAVPALGLLYRRGPSIEHVTI